MEAYGVDFQEAVVPWLAEVDQNFLVGELELSHGNFWPVAPHAGRVGPEGDVGRRAVG